MTQRKKRLKNWTIAFLSVVALGFTTSCEEDNMLTGTELVGDENMIAEPDATVSVVAYSQQLRGVRTNTSASNKSGMLGVYNEPVFGKTTMNLLTQLRLSRANPSFGGEGARVDSVKLHLPYYSKTKIDKDTTYTIDSIYAKQPMKIEVYESNYFLREMDPGTNFESSQAYYSDQAATFEQHLGAKLGELENFTPSALPIKHTVEEIDGKKDVWEPGVYMNLSPEFFEKKILDKQGDPELVSNEGFADYFRGVYFKVTGLNDAGSMFLFKMESSIIRMYYSSDPAEEDGVRPKGTLDLSLAGGTKVETIDKEPSSYVQQQLAAQDTVQGSSRLLMQGGESIVSIVKLFGEDSDGSGVPDELEQLRIDKPIVNEANLVLYVDQDATSANVPERIIIFNAENGSVLVDYAVDQTASANTLDSKAVHLGRLQRDENDKGVSYKIRVTNFISDLINRNGTNIPLGIAVIPNVEVAGSVKVKETGNVPVKGIPSGALFSPRGVVIHGPTSENEGKRLKLELYLTEVK